MKSPFGKDAKWDYKRPLPVNGRKGYVFVSLSSVAKH